MKKLLICFLICLSGCLTSNNLLDPAIPSYYRSSDKYKNLIIELIGPRDYIAQEGNVAACVEKIKPYLSKQSISYYSNIIPDVNPGKWSNSDVANIISKYRKYKDSDNTIVLYIVGLPGGGGDYTTAGEAFSYNKIVFFKDIFKGSPEYNVILHEMGHCCLGLVNNGTSLKSEHEDKNSAGHCKNPNCVMYFQQNSSTEFDDACKKDLK